MDVVTWATLELLMLSGDDNGPLPAGATGHSPPSGSTNNLLPAASRAGRWRGSLGSLFCFPPQKKTASGAVCCACAGLCSNGSNEAEDLHPTPGPVGRRASKIRGRATPVFASNEAATNHLQNPGCWGEGTDSWIRMQKRMVDIAALSP